jgi:Flp pilus assembly protein TadB
MTLTLPFIGMGLLAVAAFLMTDPLLYFWNGICRKFISDIEPEFARLHMKMSNLPITLLGWGFAMFLFLALAFIYGIWIISFTMIFIIYKSLRPILQWMIRRQKLLLRDQMVMSLPFIVNSVHAGLSLEESFKSAAKDMPEPLSKEFKHIFEEYEHGKPFNQALDDAKKRFPVESFSIFATTMITTSKHGGNLSNVLDRLRKSLEENQRLERMLEAKTASGKLTISFLAFASVAFLIYDFIIVPEGTVLFFTNVLGQIAFSTAIGLTYWGFKWGNKIMDVNF